MEDSVEGGQGRPKIFVAVLVLLTVTVISLALFTRRLARPKYAYRLPPGPRGWPVLGSLLSLGKRPHQSLYKLSKQYGPLMFMRLGSVPTLVVTSPQMAQEILKTNDKTMASRPDQFISTYLTYNQKDISFAPYGSHWGRVRKLCTLELFTPYRLNQSKGVREREVLAMLQSILEQEGNTLDMSEVLSNLTTNIMTQIVWNKRYNAAKGGSSSAEATMFWDINRVGMQLLTEVNIADFIPVLKPLYTSVDLQGLQKRVKNLHRRLDNFYQNIIEEHRKNLESTSDDNANEDFVDVLLKASQQAESDKPFSIDTVKAILTDMLSAGVDTSATTLEWALAEIVKQPSIMRKAQDELNLVVGPDRLVNEADIPNLKYIQALAKETLRLHAPVPLLLPHESTHDCEVAGYHIPAKTRVFVNVWGIQRDPAVWERALEFDPERFLKSEVDVKGQDFELLPFGSGRRMCPAINLGLATVHFSLAQLLHAFTWTLPGNKTPQELDTSDKFGITCPMAVPLKVLAKPRLSSHVIYNAM